MYICTIFTFSKNLGRANCRIGREIGTASMAQTGTDLDAILLQKSRTRDMGGIMTILTGALVYTAVVGAFLMFIRHVRSCDDNMREVFLVAMDEKQGLPKQAPLLNRAV